MSYKPTPYRYLSSAMYMLLFSATSPSAPLYSNLIMTVLFHIACSVAFRSAPVAADPDLSRRFIVGSKKSKNTVNNTTIRFYQIFA